MVIWPLERISALPLDTHDANLTIVNMRHDPRARRVVTLLISRGTITVEEARLLSGASRQLIHAWCKSRKIKAGNPRLTKVTRAWRKALEECE